MPCPGAILATKRGCCKQQFQDNTHTCCSLVSPRRAFKLLQKTFLSICRHVVKQSGVSHNKPCAYLQVFYGFQVLPTEAQDPSASGRILCAHPALDQAGSISQFPSVPHLAHIELLAPDLCQLGRKPHCTSLVPAFRCCRLTHPHTIMLTCS